jgi:hypothetical protein
MAEDQPSHETLEQLVERLEQLERVLGENSARLLNIERRLSLGTPPRRPLYKSLTDERDEASAAEPAPAGRTAGTPLDGPETGEARTPSSAPRAPQRPEPPPQSQGSDAGSAARAVTAGGSGAGAQTAGTQARAATATGATAGPNASRAGAASATVNADGGRSALKRRDLEAIIGGSWFNWVGIIAITFGVAFFLKLAFENQWVGPGARVGLGALMGLALLGVGERLRGRGMRQYAFVLSGGGVLILYLSIYAANNFYQLIGQPAAFLLMACVTTTAVLLSVRLDALPVAVLGLVGGFLTPILLSTGRDNQIGLFTYVALLDAGVLAVAYFKRWRSLDFLSFAGTVLMTLGWALKFYGREKLWTTVFFLSLFFVLYSLLAVAHNVMRRHASRWFDLLLVIANATFYFGVSYALLADAGFDRATPASQALLVSAFFTGLFYVAWARSREDRLLVYGYVGAAVTFFTMAVAIQLELQWVTITWAVEGLMLTWVGLRVETDAPRHAALAVFCAAVLHWFAWDMREFGYGAGAAFVPLLNRRALSCAVLVCALAAAARLYRRAPASSIEEGERSTVGTFFALVGNAAALTLLSLDINDYFMARLSSTDASALDARERIESARQFSLTAAWAAYGATALVLGLLKRIALLRYGALLLLVAAVGKVLSVDSQRYAASWHAPVFNHTFMAYAVLVLALACAARFYARSGGDAGERVVVLPALVLAANALALTALSLEVLGYYDRAALSAGALPAGATLYAQLDEGKAFALGVAWTLYGACSFMFGVRRYASAWRFGGLFVLALATAKAVAWDLRFYDAAWHLPVANRTLAAFALLVAAFWLVVRSYARGGEEFAEGPSARAIFTVAANVLALVALSAEASGYFQSKVIAESGGGGVPSPSGSSGLDARLRDLELAKQLSLSVIWALYGGGLLVAGRLRRVQLLRVMALALLGLTTLKVFFWDLSSLDRVYRIISFIVLGAILLAVSYLYQKTQQRAAEAEE